MRPDNNATLGRMKNDYGYFCQNFPTNMVIKENFRKAFTKTDVVCNFK